MLRIYLFFCIALITIFSIKCNLNSTKKSIILSDAYSNRRSINPWCFMKSCLHDDYKLYYGCMRNCTYWPFVHKGHCPRDVPKVNLSNPIACEPRIQDFSLLRLFHKKKLFIFIQVNWKPCVVSLEVLTGFEIGLTLVENKIPPWSRCVLLPFHSNISFTNVDRDMIFSYAFPWPLWYSSVYKVTLFSTPFDEHTYPAYRTFAVPSCHVVNESPHSCHCPDFPITVTVQGYSVAIRVKQCPQTKRYVFHVGISSKPKPIILQIASYPKGSVNTSFLVHTFHNVFNLKESSNSLLAYVVAEGYFDDASATEPVTITAWKPPLPNVTFLSDSSVRVGFVLPTDYDIAQYQFRLTQHDIVDDHITSYRTVLVHRIMASQAIESFLSTVFYDLENGYYSIQIKEARVDRGKYLKETFWGPIKKFEIFSESGNDWVLLAVLLIAVTTFLVALIILFLYLWKKGYCQPFRKSLPVSVVQWLDTQTFTWTKKTILIVWQADFRSTELMKKQSEIISCFAAFLQTVCGLNVILDMYEEVSLIMGTSDWVQTSYSKSDFVVFVCPHFDYLQDESHSGSLTGNFNRMYSYMENDLGDRSKFATVVFPYSSIDSTSATQYLKKMTSVFMLMEQIEDLYFHIQGMTRYDCVGRHGVINVTDNEYEKIPLGKALSNALKDFQEMLGDYPRYSSINGSNKPFEVEEEGLSKSNSNSLQDVNDESQPVMVHCLKSIEAPTDSDLDPKKTTPLTPIAPFVENPKEVLKVINQKSEMNLPKEEEEYCPYHDEASSVEITLPGNEDPIDDVAQERSSSPVTPVDTLQYGDSHGVGDSAYNSTKI